MVRGPGLGLAVSLSLVLGQDPAPPPHVVLVPALRHVRSVPTLLTLTGTPPPRRFPARLRPGAPLRDPARLLTVPATARFTIRDPVSVPLRTRTRAGVGVGVGDAGTGLLGRPRHRGVLADAGLGDGIGDRVGVSVDVLARGGRPVLARSGEVPGLAQGAAGFVGGAGGHDGLRRDTRSDSSRAVSSVSADSPEPRTASASARLERSMSAMRSSTVPSVISRCTWTGWVWPMR